MHPNCLRPLSGVLWRGATLVPLVSASLFGAPAAIPAAAAAAITGCQFLTPSGAPSPIKHVVHIVFDNVHFSRDIPSVPSDLEQMPHLLNFIKQNGTLVANDHTPLIAHTADDIVTGLTGVYGDQHGVPIANSFEVYDNSAVGSYNTSAFTYWTDVLPHPNIDGQEPVEMIDGNGKNLQAPWVPFVNNHCNVGAVSYANMELESANPRNPNNDVVQVFGANSAEAQEVQDNPDQAFNDFIGIAVHCTDKTCSTVGTPPVNPSDSKAKPELGGQGFGALYGHKYVATQVNPITETDGKTAITGFTEGFDPTPSWTLGYMLSLLNNNVPVVYGYIADAHDSRNDCPSSTPPPGTVKPDTANGQECGAYAPGEPGYVAQLKQWDNGFAQFFDRLDKMGLNSSNTLFVFHSDENDHYAGTQPTNLPCDGVHTACQYDRTRVGEITTNLPGLLNTQGLYQSSDLPYGIDFDSAPGFWLKGHPANGSPAVRKLEGALANVTFNNPYTNTTQKLFRFLIDMPGLAALHMLTGDVNRNAGVVGFGQESNYIQIYSLTYHDTSSCNIYPTPTQNTCINNGYIWIHGNFAEDVNHTWAAFVGPGVLNKGVDNETWVDHTDLRPTLMTLLCLKDDYSHEGRAVLEDLNHSAQPDSAQEARGSLESLGRTFKQLNAPVGEFGSDAIHVSTRAIKGDASTYSSLESQLSDLVSHRNAVAGQIEAQLDQIPGCGSGVQFSRSNLDSLNDQAQQVLLDMRRLAGGNGGDDNGDNRGGDAQE